MDSKWVDVVGFYAATELKRHSLKATAVLRCVTATRRVRNAGPVPVDRSCAVRKLVIEHRANHIDGFTISGIGIPADERVHKLSIRAGGIVLPIEDLLRFGIEYRI